MIQIRKHFRLIPVTPRGLKLNFTSIGLVFELYEYYYLILFILLLVCVIKVSSINTAVLNTLTNESKGPRTKMLLVYVGATDSSNQPKI